MHVGQRLVLAVAAIALVLAGTVTGLLLANRSDDGNVGNTAQAQEMNGERGIRAHGEGRVSVVPDIARVVLGVQVEGEDLNALRDEVNSRMDTIISGLQDDGVAEEDIQTATYDISVRRDWESEGQPITGYIVTHTVDVKIRDLDQAGTIIDNAIDNGANNVGNIRFEVEDREAAIRQAREQAMTDAREKAQHLADLASVGLGSAVYIDESSPSQPPIPYEQGAADAREEEAADQARIEPGQSVITVNVTVVYAIE